MNLAQFRAAVIAVLDAELAALVPRPKVSAHGGRFSLEELKRIQTAAPAVFAAVLGIADAVRTATGRIEADVLMAAFLVTSTRPGVPRDAAALALASQLLTSVPEQRWKVAGPGDISEQVTGTPQELRGQNLFSSEIDKNAVALWALTWKQRVCLFALDETTLPDFTTWHAEYDVGKTADTENPQDTLDDLDQ